MASSNVTLKLLVDKKNQRVLFAEAGKDFVDFLFSLQALPVGTVISLLDNRDIAGGLAKVYQSISDLNDDYIQSDQNKDVLLKPKSSLPFFSPQLSLLSPEAISSPVPATDTSPTFYKCNKCDVYSTHYSYYCPSQCCKGAMSSNDSYVLKSAVDAKGMGFVKGLVTYMVMDDLVVSPMSTLSNITSILDKFNIKDLGALEEKVVEMGTREGLQLLKCSLNSKTVLTDVFLGELVDKDDNLKKV